MSGNISSEGVVALTDAPSPHARVLVRLAQQRLRDIAADPDVDSSGNRGKDGPEEAVPQRRDVGDDDVLEEEEAGDAEDVDRGAGCVGVDVLGGSDDDVAECVQEDAERVALDAACDVGDLGDWRLRDGLQTSEGQSERSDRKD